MSTTPDLKLPWQVKGRCIYNADGARIGGGVEFAAEIVRTMNEMRGLNPAALRDLVELMTIVRPLEKLAIKELSRMGVGLNPQVTLLADALLETFAKVRTP